jgi:uncharacterized membrane protein (DUF2068 family)
MIGITHVFFGFWLLSVSQPSIDFSAQTPSTIYSVYTVAFGFAVTIFAYGIWLQKKWGLYGTVVTSLFVTFADVLTILNLPSIPGIPKLAAVPEIIYSLFVMLYLFQSKIRTGKRVAN